MAQHNSILSNAQISFWAMDKEKFKNTKEKIAIDMYKAGQFRIFPEGIDWKAERKHYQVYLRDMLSYPRLLNALADAMYELIKELPYGRVKLAAVPEAGNDIAAAIACRHDVPAIRIRKDPLAYLDVAKSLDESGHKKAAAFVQKMADPITMKNKMHGKKELILGKVEQGDNLLLLDNVVSSAAGTKIQSIEYYVKALESAGLKLNQDFRFVGVGVVIINSPHADGILKKFAKERLDTDEFLLIGLYTVPEYVEYIRPLLSEEHYKMLQQDITEWKN